MHARKALKEGYIKPTKKVFDNAKVSDHFAIIPTLQAPKSLTEIEAKLYDMVVKRFLAVFFPPAEFLVTTRISTVKAAGKELNFQTNGKVLVKPGWLAVYGKEVQEDDANLVAVAAGEVVRPRAVDVKSLATKPPARYTKATLLSAMEGAGKLIDDEELREAMAEKGLGTPATRAATIEGLLSEKYMIREGRDLIPTAKAFQLMTLLRGLAVDELTKPELTGNWEFQLAEMEKGRLDRDDLHGRDRRHDPARGAEGQGIRPRHHPRRLRDPEGTLPEMRRRGQGELPPLHLHRHRRQERGLRLLHRQDPRRPQFRAARGGEIPGRQEDRPAGRLPLQSRLALHRRDGPGLRRRDRRTGSSSSTLAKTPRRPRATASRSTSVAQTSLGACPKCQGHVYDFGSNYVCEHAVGAAVTCDFKSGKIILQQPIEAAQMQKLLASGKTDLMENFVSNKTRRKFKAFLAFDKKEGKVSFEFEPRAAKVPAAKKAAAKKTAAKA